MSVSCIETRQSTRFSAHRSHGIALGWIGSDGNRHVARHGSIETPQIYLDANLAMKEQALAKVQPLGARLRRDKPDDALLSFLKDL